MINEYAGDANATINMFEAHPQLKALAREINARWGCTFFTIHGANVPSVTMFTRGGFPIGSAGIRTDYDTQGKAVERFYITSTDCINKQRGARRIGKSTRLGTTIPGLIRSFIKNDKAPVDSVVLPEYISICINAINQSEPSFRGIAPPKVDIPNDVVVEMLKSHLKLDTFKGITYDLAGTWERYRERAKTFEVAVSVPNRLRRGCKAIFCMAHIDEKKPFYMVGDISVLTNIPESRWGKLSQADYQLNLKPCSSLLGHDDLIADITIINEWFGTSNQHEKQGGDLRIRRHDMYHEEIDVAVYYHGSCTVALIPKHGE